MKEKEKFAACLLICVAGCWLLGDAFSRRNIVEMIAGATLLVVAGAVFGKTQL